MATERKESTPPAPPNAEKDAQTTDQRIDLEAVFEGDESSLEEKPEKSKH